LTIAIADPANAIGGAARLVGAVRVTPVDQSLAAAAVSVTLNVLRPGTSSVPYGAFDTPASNADGALTGSFAVTGWALDDIGVERVEIWRDLATTEPPSAAYTTDPSHPAFGKVFIAEAFFVQGARPDVEAIYPEMPLAYRAGWGYLLLSWGLFGQGNGSYRLYAWAYDKEGNHALLGTKTIAVANASAIKPFGALDTPAYGATVSGGFWNYGWALTPNATPVCRIQPGLVLMTDFPHFGG
jgi:hypothetical protein